MKDNVIKTDTHTLIFNGGQPLKDTPQNWAAAEAWAEQANNANPNIVPPEKTHPLTWSWDCGFKLDFDGGLVEVGSRFYHPSTYGGPNWAGTVTVFIAHKKAIEKRFDCPDLPQLEKEVNAFISEIQARLFAALDSFKI